jgi:hypothetical protein
VHTSRGTLQREQVLLATGATRHGSYASFGWLRRRIVPIGSFIVVTEPLGAERASALLRERRTYVTVANIHHYFRLTPDHRLVFGGRARFGVSNPVADAKSGEILRAGMVETFPSLEGVGIDYCWGGLVDMTQDRLPHAGEHDGLFYSTGYSGHGTQMSVLMGERMAAVMAGDASANPWLGRKWPAIPGHLGSPWFLPRWACISALRGRPRLRAAFLHDSHDNTVTRSEHHGPDRKSFDTLVGPEESRRLFGALQRGATRRDILAMLMAGGMQATLAGGLATTALSVHAQTPRAAAKIASRVHAAGHDTLDPAKQSNQTDYSRCNMLYNGLTLARRQPHAAAGAGRDRSTPRTRRPGSSASAQGRDFHDGKPLTPADVVYSISRHKDPATASKAKVLADQIESVKATARTK